MKVLYFTVVPIASEGNGGSICCRNHVQRLATDPAIELVGMTAGPLALKERTDAFFAQFNVKHYFQPFREGQMHHEHNTLSSIANFACTAVFQFPWELQALNQRHIEEGIAWAIRGYSIDLLVIDYHPSALFIELPRTDAKTVLISLNREGDFYRDQIELGQTHHGSLTAGISLARARRWERNVDAAVDQLVTIGSPDLPRHPTRRQPLCITPYLDPKPVRWSHHRTGSVFFVGAIGHYPNRLAIRWLTEELGPALARLGSTVRIKIVGANEGDIPEHYRHSNIDLLGYSDAGTVAELFRTSDAMICPVENDYGVKFKSLEALSYGIPLIASKQTLLGLPYLSWSPFIELDKPDAAASFIDYIISDPGGLKDLAALQQEAQSSFIASQQGIWSRIMAPLLGS